MKRKAERGFRNQAFLSDGGAAVGRDACALETSYIKGRLSLGGAYCALGSLGSSDDRHGDIKL